MFSAIMTKPDFGEVCFLIAFILFVIAFFIVLAGERVPWSRLFNLLLVAGLAFIALGWLAL